MTKRDSYPISRMDEYIDSMGDVTAPLTATVGIGKSSYTNYNGIIPWLLLT